MKASFASSIMAKAKKPPRKQLAASRRAGLSAAPAGRELEELNRIGIALSETRDVERLLVLILSKAREITGADAGSLYLVEQGSGDSNDPSATFSTRSLPPTVRTRGPFRLTARSIFLSFASAMKKSTPSYSAFSPTLMSTSSSHSLYS